MNRLSPLFEFKSADLNKDGYFAGYASTFGDQPDSYGDTISKGAFSETLKTHQERKTSPAMLWQHNPDAVIGKWLALEEDSYGLAVEGKLTLGTQRGREAYELMKDDAVSMSIGGRVEEDGFSKVGDKRFIKNMNLLEISIVSVPANPYAQITDVKSIRDFEAGLRDVFGYSNRQAKRIAAGGWSALSRDDSSDELKQLVAEVRLLTNAIKGN